MLKFIYKLISHRGNVKGLIEANGVRTLIDLLTLAHLHTSRASLPAQSNVIEAGPNMERHSEELWYYTIDANKTGPVSFEKVSLPLLCFTNLSMVVNYF